MQRADSPGPTELDGLIERAYQEFADVTELLADEQRDAEAAASAEVPVLQQMIDLKQKEVEQLEPRVLQLKTEQEAARQKIASLNARVEAARGRSRRVATLAGRVSGKIMSSTRPQSPKLAKSSNARQLRQNNTGSSAHPRRSSGVSTSSEAGRLPLEAPKDARLACGETSSSCSLIPSRSIEVSEPRAALSLPDSPGITIAGKETTECPDSENTGHRPRATPPPSCGRDIRRSGRRRTTPQRFSTNSAFSQSAIDSEKIMKRRRLHHDDGSSDRSGDTTQAQRNLWMRRASSPSELAVDNPGILPNTVSANARRKQKPLKGVANPETGKLYLGRWDRGSGSTWYIVVILPIGDLESVGMTGSIHDTALVDGHIPVFYNSWQKRILGWKEDYKDGGPYVARRKYPVMWFEDGRQMILREGRFQISSSGGFSWLSASNLLPFSEYGPDNSLVSGYAVALSFAEELEAMDVSRRARIEVPAASKEVYDEDRSHSSSTSSRSSSRLSLAVVMERPNANAPDQLQTSTTVHEREEVAGRAERLPHDTEIQDDREVRSTSRQHSPLDAGAGGTHPLSMETSRSSNPKAQSTCRLARETITSATSSPSMFQLASEAAAVAGKEQPAFDRFATVSGYQPQSATGWQKSDTNASATPLQPKNRSCANSTFTMSQQNPHANLPNVQHRQQTLPPYREIPISTVPDESSGDDPRSPIAGLTSAHFPSRLLGSAMSVEQRGPLEHFQHNSGGTRGVHVVDQGIEMVQEERTSPTQTVASNSLATPVWQIGEMIADVNGSPFPRFEVEPSQDHRVEVEKASLPTATPGRSLMTSAPHAAPISATFAEQGLSSAAGPARRNPQRSSRNPNGVDNSGEPSSPCDNQSPHSQSTVETAQTTLSPIHPSLTRQVPSEGPYPTMAIQHVLSADIQTSVPDANQVQHCAQGAEPLPASGQSDQQSAMYMGHAAQVASTAGHNPRRPAITFGESVKDCRKRPFLTAQASHGEDFLCEMVRLYEPSRGKGMWSLVTRAFNSQFGCEESKEALQMRYGRLKQRKGVASMASQRLRRNWLGPCQPES